MKMLRLIFVAALLLLIAGIARGRDAGPGLRVAEFRELYA
jgi:hypothetical protein